MLGLICSIRCVPERQLNNKSFFLSLSCLKKQCVYRDLLYSIVPMKSRRGRDRPAYRRPHEDRFVVINVIQGYLERLHGLIWWLPLITCHNDQLQEKHREGWSYMVNDKHRGQHSQSPTAFSKGITKGRH